jgi:hypothetical protein
LLTAVERRSRRGAEQRAKTAVTITITSTNAADTSIVYYEIATY